MVLSRNPEYHGRFRGNVQQVKLLPLAEWSTELELYEADGLDIWSLWAPSLPDMDRVRQQHTGEYVSAPWLQVLYVGFDVSRPPFDDRRVRRALAYAVDRETLADVALGGYSFPATGGLVPAGMPGHSAGIGLPYDPEQARQLLAEAGYPGGRGFPVLDSLTCHGRESQSEQLQAQWRENLGIEITWETLEWTTFIDRVNMGPPHMFLPLGWIADYPDPDSFLRIGLRNYSPKWRNEVYERLVEEARRVTDQRERMKMYREADMILVEEAPIMPLTYGRHNWLVKPWVRRFPTSPIGWWFWKDVIIEPH